jgi:preprotein translocase subunit SecG
MATVLLVIHLMIAAALVGVVLMQKSEGGALGIGGGDGGAGGFLTGRGHANFLTRVTAGLAAAFFVTSILLTLIANNSIQSGSVFDTVKPANAPASAPASAPADASKGQGGILDELQKGRAPAVPHNQ